MSIELATGKITTINIADNAGNLLQQKGMLPDFEPASLQFRLNYYVLYNIKRCFIRHEQQQKITFAVKRRTVI